MAGVKYFFLFMFSLCCFGILSAEINPEATKAKKEVPSDQEMESYYASLRAEIEKQDAYAQGLVKQASRGEMVPSQIQRVKMQQAIITLEVKRTLFANFYKTPTIEQSPQVREALKQLLSQFDIAVPDLAAFQNLVEREKKRLGIN